jgi:gliding motility-associated-like protein
MAPPVGPDFAITSGPGIDPNTPGPAGPPLPVVCPGFGNHSIVLNPGYNPGYTCERLTFPLTVTAQDTNFIYAYALVIQDGYNINGQQHTETEQPYVEIIIRDANGDIINCGYKRYYGGTNEPGFYYVNGSIFNTTSTDQYKPWTIVGANLSNYLGQNLTVEINNVDCSLGGHFVTSYWDFLCGTNVLQAGCVGSQSNVCAPSDPSISYNYQWYRGLNNPIPASQGGNQQCITLTPVVGDTFIVKLTNPDDTCYFYLSYVPDVVQPSISYTAQCSTATFSAQAAPAGNASVTSWSWSFPGGTPSSATGPNTTVSYPGPGSYTVTLTATIASGCSFDTTYQVNLVNTLAAGFTVDDACENELVAITDTSVTGASDPISSWSWTFPTGTPATSSIRNPQVTFPPGTHTVNMTVQTASGCIQSVQSTVQVYSNPVADFNSPSPGCVPLCHTFTDNSTSVDGPITAWDWTFGGGNPGSSTKSTIPVCWNNPGSYNVSLRVTTQFGCEDDIIKSGIVNALPVPAATIVGTTRVCQNGEPPVVNLFGSGSVAPYTIDYLLNGAPQQGVTDQSGLLQVTVPTDNPGLNTYTLQAVTSSGTPACSSQTGNQKVEVIVDPLPIPEFQAAPKDCPSSPSVYFYNESQFGSTYRWEFGDGGFSDEQSPTHYYHFGGDYTIRLVAISPFGCVDSISKDIHVEQDFRIWYPNAFTPNEDDLNENFYPIYISASEIDFAVFNRWGKEVFRSRELSKGWNGRFEGAPAPEGAYVFTVKATDLCGEQISYTGKFFLIR